MIILNYPKKDIFGEYIDLYDYYYNFIPKNLIEIAKTSNIDLNRVLVIFNNKIITLKKALEIINKYNLHNVDYIISNKKNIIDELTANPNIFESLERSLLNSINKYKSKKRFILEEVKVKKLPIFINNKLLWYLSDFNENIYLEFFTDDLLNEVDLKEFFSNKELLEKYFNIINKKRFINLLNLYKKIEKEELPSFILS